MSDYLDENREDSWPVRQVPISDDLWDEAQAIAHANGATADDVIRYLLAEYIQREGGKTRRPS